MREENRLLRERLGLNSSNSSKPPSSDAPGAPRQPKKRTGRRPGGQPGHKKHERALLPPENVRHVVELVPRECRGCKRRLHGQDSSPRRHQVVEVPPLSAIVTEYRCHALQCPDCGLVTRGELPAHARRVFGDRLAALASLLVGKYRLSKRLVKDALSDMLGVELSVGSVSNLEGEMSQALAPAAAEALDYVRDSRVASADETGFAQGREGGRAARAWLWVVATALVVVFHIARNRSGKVARQLLGEDYAGFLTTDRWSAYEWVDTGLRQLCWAHLTRDFQGFIDRGGEGGRIGRKLMHERDCFFEWYHRVRDGTLAREEFENRMRGVERKVGQLLREAARRAEKKTAGMAR
ncbi:IS66 family transposase, partial [Archangium sp. Cb G35]